MVEIIKPGTKIDFVGKLRFFTILSAAFMLVSLILIFSKGLNPGIDFSGGTVIQVKFNKAVSLDDVRKHINTLNREFLLQDFGNENEILIRIADHDGTPLKELSDEIEALLISSFPDDAPELQRVEQVGPQIGHELRYKAFMAVFFSSLGVLIYLAIRFEILFSIGAIVSLIHDIIFILGAYAISGKEFNLTVMAALLTAAGYSLNDTIVIFDRIREKLKTNSEKSSWKDIINLSINETLSRTILTSLLTLLAVVSLFIFGGPAISGFALVMIIGIVIGTYSSIGVATMFVYYVKQKKVK